MMTRKTKDKQNNDPQNKSRVNLLTSEESPITRWTKSTMKGSKERFLFRYALCIREGDVITYILPLSIGSVMIGFAYVSLRSVRHLV